MNLYTKYIRWLKRRLITPDVDPLYKFDYLAGTLVTFLFLNTVGLLGVLIYMLCDKYW